MKLSELIKEGYLEDTKKGYVIKKNFALNDLLASSTLDKPLIIPKNHTVCLTGKIGAPVTVDHTGKDPLFVSAGFDRVE